MPRHELADQKQEDDQRPFMQMGSRISQFAAAPRWSWYPMSNVWRHSKRHVRCLQQRPKDDKMFPRCLGPSPFSHANLGASIERANRPMANYFQNGRISKFKDNSDQRVRH